MAEPTQRLTRALPAALAAFGLLLAGAAPAQEDDPFADDAWGDDEWSEADGASAWNGFAEAGYGNRFSTDPLTPNRATLEDLRLRLETEWQPGKATVRLEADVGYDGIENDWIRQVRDLSVSFRAGASTDVAVGRTVQTWGTGDLLFLNDLFPKDFVSFFAGRDDEYLKAPSNVVRVTRFGGAVNVDFVWTPDYEPDVYLTGERFSFFFPPAGVNVAPDPPLDAVEPGGGFANGEFALRLFRTIEGTEYAAYGYRGFFKQPLAFTSDGRATFAPLSALGASVRRPLGPGLFNGEFAYYDSRDDRGGDDPFVPNDQLRLLAGYEWEAAANFTVGLQYYLEWTLDHDALIDNSPFPDVEPEEYRHVVTTRLTRRFKRDKYTLSLFAFASPSDRDAYLRPSFTWRYSDQWSFVAGANLFTGSDANTFFAQFEDASNAYVRLRFNY